MKIGTGTVIYRNCEIRNGAGISIGKFSSVGHECKLDGRGGLKIGNSVNLSSGVWIWTQEHGVNCPMFSVTSAPVTVGDYVWLGGRVIVLPGVKIGVGAVVASGAVVTKDVEDYSIVAGVPARKIGVRTSKLNYKLASCMPLI